MAQKRLFSALAEGRAALASFPLIDAAGDSLHLESPLRIQLEPGAGPSRRHCRLPLAARAHRLTGAADLRVWRWPSAPPPARPGRAARGPAPLVASATATRGLPARGAVRRPQPRASSSPETHARAPPRDSPACAELARLGKRRAACARLEHAGPTAGLSIDHLFEDWPDPRSSSIRRSAPAPGATTQRAGFVGASVALLHGLRSRSTPGGVRAEDDNALWACGIDG